MRIAIIIPDRGDRPEFLANCIQMLKRQTLCPAYVHVMDLPPDSDKPDITKRYRKAYENLMAADLPIDLISLVENDDWYSPTYLETMAWEWKRHGKPDIFGINYTIYYHLKLRKYFRFIHDDRASAMNTFLRPGLTIKWPADDERYTDIHLWDTHNGPRAAIDPGKILSIGMKHGMGMAGGAFHINKLDRYTEEDNGFLKAHLDEESFEFYSSITEKLN